MASAAFEVAPVTVYDTDTSPLVNKAVAEAVGARSAAFVPLVAGERVIAVLAVATTHEHRRSRPRSSARCARSRPRRRSGWSAPVRPRPSRRRSSASGCSPRSRARCVGARSRLGRPGGRRGGRHRPRHRALLRPARREAEELRIAAEWAATASRLVQARTRACCPRPTSPSRPARRSPGPTWRRSSRATRARRCSGSGRARCSRPRSSRSTARSACSPSTGRRRARGASPRSRSPRRSPASSASASTPRGCSPRTRCACGSRLRSWRPRRW